MTIAFVLQTYSHLDQVERLARTLKRGCSDCLIVISHRGSKAECKRLADNDCVDHVIPSPGGRGRFSLIDGLISSMRWLEKQSKPYDWLVVMSGQDYPIRKLCELETELAGSSFDGYFHHFEAFNEAEAMAPPMFWPQWDVKHRYLFRYALLKENTSLIERAVLKMPRLLLERTERFRIDTSYGLLVGYRPDEMPFSADFKLYGGSYWMIVNRRAVRVVLDFIDERPDIVHYFRDVIIPDEAFLQTVMANNPDLKLSRHDLRYAQFAGSSHGRPKEFSMADLDEVLASGCYIARKFNARRNPEVLEALDKRLM